METLRKIFLVCVVLCGTAAVIATADAKQPESQKTNGLGVEVLLKDKPFYFSAATSKNNVSAFVRVPVNESNSERVSAVKFMPRMNGDKVDVSVYVLRGDASNIKSCEDWKQLKESFVGTYSATEGEKIQLTALNDFGVKFGEEVLALQIVPKKMLSSSSALNNGDGGGGCECGTCGGLTCCPNPGYCLGCGSYGDVCCAPPNPD